jgi:hypothetical protein
MKRNILLIVLAGLLFSVALVAGTKAEEPKNERALVQFTQTVKFKNVFLRGQYLIVHDADKMAKGEDCTWIFDAEGKVVASFHCTPVARERADSFKLIVSRRNAAFDIPDVREIQFAGSTEGHLVP